MNQVRAQGKIRWFGGALVICTVAILTFANPSRGADAPKNLIPNGDFSLGGGDFPEGGWHTEAWLNEPDKFQSHRIVPPNGGGPVQLEVVALKEDDARWQVPITLAPGWYEISADARAEDIPADKDGASVSVFPEGVIMSPQLHGTTGWQRLRLYLKVSDHPADIEVALRIGGFGSLNTGRAFFKNAAVYQIPGPPPSATPTFDLSQVRKGLEYHPANGSSVSVVFTFILLAGAAAWGWWMFGDQEILPAPPPKPAEVRVDRKSNKPQRKARS
ncbi:MAG TPA: hypothetical protein VMU16_13955 [Candidatus Binataceae bacterium]|nr:hypothetical protein [Candidatus Binataceae bacterium]